MSAWCIAMPPKRKSSVLDHFSYHLAPVPGKYNVTACNYCGEHFIRRACGTDVLKAHLAGDATSKAHACKKVPDDVRESWRAGAAGATNAVRSSSRQLTLGAAVDTSLQRNAEVEVARWAFACGVPFFSIENHLFQSAMRSVALAGARFKPPSRKKLATKLLDLLYSENHTEVDATLQKVWKFGFSICFDGWSDVHSHPLVNAMVMTAQGQFSLGSEDASNVQKSGEYLSSVMQKYITQLGAENVVCVVTDNASNCVEAGLLVEDTQPHITWLGCVPHCISLLLKDLCKLSWVSNVVKKVSEVCMPKRWVLRCGARRIWHKCNCTK
jgi:hypothetical protein